MIDQNHIQTFQEFLSSHPDIASRFEALRTSRKVAKGHIIVGQGENNQDMFLLLSGAAKVVIYSRGGHEIQLAEFSSETLFGEMAVILGASRSSNVVAKTNCTLATISASEFKSLMQDFPKLAIYMTQLLAHRLQQTSQNLFETQAFTLTQRLYEFLLRRAVQSSESSEIFRLSPAPSVTALSEALNVSREATSRAVTKLTTRGIIKKDKIYWDIIRPDFEDY